MSESNLGVNPHEEDSELDNLNSDVPPDGEEPLDPGELEGVKKHEPSPTHPRFKQIYAEAKQNKAKVEELNQKFADTDVVFNELRSQNEQLVKTLQDFQTGQQKAAEATNQTTLQTTLASLKAQRSEALDGDDHKKAYDLQDQIQELIIKMNAPVPMKNEGPADIDKALEERETKQAVGVFTSEAPWFNPKSAEYDPIMAGAAKEIDSILSADPVWGRKPIIDQLREVKSRVETRFGYKTEVKAPKKPAGSGHLPGVGPVDLGGGSAGNSVTLTADQVKVARMLFPNDRNPEVKYAEQLKLIRRS